MVRELAPSRSVSDPDEGERAVRDFLHAKVKMAELKQVQDELRPLIIEHLEKSVDPDAEGHRVLSFDEKIEGFAALQYQRRVKRLTDLDAAMRILDDAGLTESCIRYEPVLDEDAVMARLYTDELTESQVDEMFPQEISFALVPKKK